MIDLLAMKRSLTPMGNRLYGGGGGDDGGVAARQAVMKAEQDDAIARINTLFGKGDGVPLYANGQYVTDRGGFRGLGAGQQIPNAPTGYDVTERDANAAEREALYGTITQDASARLLSKLADERDRAERGTRFQLARQGLAGGSSDVDAGRRLLEAFQEGSLEAGNAALGAGNAARSADEKTRVGIINNIRNGMSSADAVSASFAALTNNANEVRDAALQTNIGGFFDDINNLNAQRQYNLGAQGARERYGNGGGGVATSGNSGGTGGRITR